jgi:hypothetical protein
VRELLRRRFPPFLVAGVLLGLVTLAVFRLPESFIAQLENGGPFNLTQRGWVFRLLAAFAILQATYVGFGVLRSEHVKKAREKDPKMAALSRTQLMSGLSWNAAAIIVLTAIYGVAMLGFTGERAGFWFFFALGVVQGAWYYREIGQIGRWLGFQPETVERSSGDSWEPDPSTYSPPLTRGLGAGLQKSASR